MYILSPEQSLCVAEMTKLLENIYRCVNIALVNESKLLCILMGIGIGRSQRLLRPSHSDFNRSIQGQVCGNIGTLHPHQSLLSSIDIEGV
jgi:hypothetical protein